MNSQNETQTEGDMPSTTRIAIAGISESIAAYAFRELRAGIAEWTRRALTAEAEMAQARQLVRDVMDTHLFDVPSHEADEDLVRRVNEFLNRE